ncbi:MAG: hypothetical protein QM611_02600 [Microbacterium sp.]|uniref:hypothetical protein n=1 Tax=Microbacterium sp. TaxID=51671 RepID=UPI0039E56EF5
MTTLARLPASPIALILVAEAPLAGVDLRHGRFHRVRRGVHADAQRWAELRPWERYRARVHAYALLHPEAVFAYESAAVLLGLPIFGEPRDIHVLSTPGGKSRRFGDVVVHGISAEREIVTISHVRATSPARTAADLMRVLPPAFAVAVGDAVLSPAQGGTTSIDELSAIARACAGMRGARQLELLLPLLDPRSESAGESVSRVVVLWCGFETPELQVEFVTDGHKDRVDFWWKRILAMGESDGYEKYRGSTAEETIARTRAEKQRELRLYRHCSTLGRWDWAATLGVTPLEEQLDRMGVPRVGPRREALLATVGTSPRSLPASKPIAPRETHRR